MSNEELLSASPPAGDGWTAVGGQPFFKSGNIYHLQSRQRRRRRGGQLNAHSNWRETDEEGSNHCELRKALMKLLVQKLYSSV